MDWGLRLLVAWLSLAMCAHTTAQTGPVYQNRDWRLCAQWMPDKTGIDACNRIITNKDLSGGSLARVYQLRGRQYFPDSGKGNRIELDLAISDFSESIRLQPNDFEAYNDRGRAFMTKGDYAAAVTDFTAAISRNSSNYPIAFFNRAEAQHKLKRYNLAISDFSVAIESGPSFYLYPNALRQRGLSYQSLKKYEEAIADFTKAMAYAKGGDTTAIFFRGRARAEKKDFDGAISDFTDVIAIENGKNADAYIERGIAYHDKSKFDLAIADFDIAISLTIGRNPEAFYLRGGAYARKTLHDQAIRDFSKAIALNPNGVADYYNDRGLSYEAVGKLDLAIADYTSAIGINPNSTLWRYNRANAYAKQRKFDVAITDYTKVVELEPFNHYAYLDRGLAHAELKNYTKAVDDYSRALEIKKDFALALNNRGVVRRILSNFKLALADFTAAVELNITPETTQLALNNRGYTYFLLGDYERSLADYSRVIDLTQQKSWGPLFDRGLYYLRVGEFEKAIQDYSRVIVLGDGDTSSAYANRGRAHFLNGDDDNAIRDYTRALALGHRERSLILANRGESYYFKRDLPRAIADYTRAIEVAPQPGAFEYTGRARALAAMANYGRAIDDYNKAIAIYGRDKAAYFGRAEAQLALGRYYNSATDYGWGYLIFLSQLDSFVHGISLTVFLALFLVSAGLLLSHLAQMAARIAQGAAASPNYWILGRFIWVPVLVPAFFWDFPFLTPGSFGFLVFDALVGISFVVFVLAPTFTPILRDYFRASFDWRTLAMTCLAVVSLPAAMSLVTLEALDRASTNFKMSQRETVRTAFELDTRSVCIGAPISRSSSTPARDISRASDPLQEIVWGSAAPLSLFWADNMIKAALFDAPELSGCGLTNITFNRDSFVMKVVVFSFRTFVSLVVGAILLVPLAGWLAHRFRLAPA